MLIVPIMLSNSGMQQLFDYDRRELDRLEVEIRGLRMFYLHSSREGGVAGNQFHRLRTEVTFVIEGVVDWELEDLRGGTRAFQMTSQCAVWIPPFVLHRVTFGPEGGTLATLANTIYVRNDPRTHDTYSADEFRALQAEFQEGSHET